MSAYGILAGSILVAHCIWIAWVIFGWPLARNRRGWRWFHAVSLVYGVIIEVVPWPCPLTLAEQWCESRAGITPYHQPFLVHYLEALIYPDVPPAALIAGAAAVCGLNLYLHARRWLRTRRPAVAQVTEPRW